MITRVQKNVSKRYLPVRHDWETRQLEPDREASLLTGRSAAILGASFVIAVCAGFLTYLAVRGQVTGLAGAVLAGGAAFAGAVRLLNSIIA